MPNGLQLTVTLAYVRKLPKHPSTKQSAIHCICIFFSYIFMYLCVHVCKGNYTYFCGIFFLSQNEPRRDVEMIRTR